MQIERIVAGLSLDRLSDGAIQRAMSLAREYGARLDVVHGAGVEAPHLGKARRAFFAEHRERALERAREAARGRLELLVEDPVYAELPLDDYATWGIGLFEVIATGTGSGFSCEATTLIDVEGSSVATVAGLSGLALLVVGAVGVLVLIMRGGRAGGQPFAGVFFGALLGIGVGTLLQQFGVLYPTIPVSIVVVAAGALVGLLAGMIGFRPLEGAP